MKMSKQVWKAAVPLAVGGVLLATSGMSAMAGTSGYEAYKAALKQQHTVQSVTADVQVTLTDNGKPVWKAAPLVKIDREGGQASGEVGIESGSKSERVAFFTQPGGGVVLKHAADDTYYAVGDHGDEKKHSHSWKTEEGEGPDAGELEGLVDALAGSLKQQMTLEAQPDGSQRVELQLSAAQIPPAVQALGSLAVKHASDPEHRHPSSQEGEGLPPWMKDGEALQLPRLTRDIRIESFHLTADIAPDGTLKGQVLELAADGKDAEGVEHDLALSAQLKLSGQNATTADTVDLTGKPVVTLHKEEEHR
ncbi:MULTISPECIES: hypothetical protein [Paenibacillus]|uniref:hypothetical protein n=1 Tax=Paenibacillus TaxID=44249 RepID=UPI0022B92E1B|nr:hypothetical protein [Paenibacillus caseinilyticus]MCZ8523259.1 hypothetical protein [Paenibacillus caseinilyticus]